MQARGRVTTALIFAFIVSACGSSYGEDDSKKTGSSSSSSSSSGTATPDVKTGPVSNPGKVACGTQVCDLAMEACCVDGGDFKCQPLDSSCSSKAVCDEKADCPDGQICCGSGGFTGSTVNCQKTCDGITEAQACMTDAECGTQGCIQQSCAGITTYVCGLNPFCSKL